MERELIITEDGSHSIRIPGLNENYHSTHGALQESQHVFIKNGLETLSLKSIRIFEMGLGTGLNALLSLLYSKKHAIDIRYTAIEKYPISLEESQHLNYPEILGETREAFELLHSSNWNQSIQLTPGFSFQKIQTDLRTFHGAGGFDLIYFDAFGPDVQPDLWTWSSLKIIHDVLREGGLFVTYSAKGQVRRNLESLGFKTQRVPGPPGKREMIRAIKQSF